MKNLINYIRSCFCVHDWELIHNVSVNCWFRHYESKTYRCKKCGLSKRYKSN